MISGKYAVFKFKLFSLAWGSCRKDLIIVNSIKILEDQAQHTHWGVYCTFFSFLCLKIDGLTCCDEPWCFILKHFLFPFSHICCFLIMFNSLHLHVHYVSHKVYVDINFASEFISVMLLIKLLNAPKCEECTEEHLDTFSCGILSCVFSQFVLWCHFFPLLNYNQTENFNLSRV